MNNDKLSIKEARKKVGLTQQGLSDWLGIPKRTIENWDAEKNQPADWVRNLLVDKILTYKPDSLKYAVVYSERGNETIIFSSNDYTACEEQRKLFSAKISKSAKGVTEDCFVIDTEIENKKRFAKELFDEYLETLPESKRSEIIEINGKKYLKAFLDFSEEYKLN